MKIGYSMAFMEMLKAEEISYGDCAEFHIVCPVCRQATFKGVRKNKTHYLSHYHADTPEARECELRVAALHAAISHKLASPFEGHGQTLDQFMAQYRKHLVIGQHRLGLMPAHVLEREAYALMQHKPFVNDPTLTGVGERIVSGTQYSNVLGTLKLMNEFQGRSPFWYNRQASYVVEAIQHLTNHQSDRNLLFLTACAYVLTAEGHYDIMRPPVHAMNIIRAVAKRKPEAVLVRLIANALKMDGLKKEAYKEGLKDGFKEGKRDWTITRTEHDHKHWMEGIADDHPKPAAPKDDLIGDVIATQMGSVRFPKQSPQALDVTSMQLRAEGPSRQGLLVNNLEIAPKKSPYEDEELVRTRMAEQGMHVKFIAENGDVLATDKRPPRELSAEQIALGRKRQKEHSMTPHEEAGARKSEQLRRAHRGIDPRPDDLNIDLYRKAFGATNQLYHDEQAKQREFDAKFKQHAHEVAVAIAKALIVSIVGLLAGVEYTTTT